MANTTWYGDGTATVAVGSRTVTGTDTGWLTEVAGLTPIKVGDKFGIHVGRPIVIEQIISDTELLLADDWPGPAQTDAPYKVELTSPTIAAVEAMRRLLASLSNGNLDSLSEISVGTDDIPIGIGPGVFGTINKFMLKDGVQFDVAVPNMAGRAAYNGAAAGFRVLVADIGDGRSALYIKNSATSGDWSAPYYITGPVGPAGVNQRGNYSAGTAYAIRDIVQYGGSTWIAKVATTGNAPPTLPTAENTQWLLFARSGTAGVVDRGAYSAATAYEANDIVLNNGSTWIALQPTTGNAPPVLPTESNAYWRLLARKGTDGAGTGDFVGPSGGVASGDIVAFGDTTGKIGRKATQSEVRAAIGGIPIAGHFYGLTLSNNVSDATNDIDIAAGDCASDDAIPSLMTLSASLTKRLDAAWAVGTGNGGLDTGSIGNNTYHVWLIQRSDTGVVDALLSLSATAPTLPVNYDRKAYLWPIIRRGNSIVPFKQVGNCFWKVSADTDRDSTAAAASSLLALSVPTGVHVRPILQSSLNTAANSSVSNFVGDPRAASAANLEFQSVYNNATVGVISEVTTNKSAQIYWATSVPLGTVASNTLKSFGWYFDRKAQL